MGQIHRVECIWLLMSMLKTNLSDLIGFVGAGEVPKKEDELAKSLKERQSEKVLEDYEKKLQNDELFEMMFTQQDYNIGLWAYDQGVKVLLKNEELADGKYRYLFNGALARPFSVKIKDIDKENKTVNVSFKAAQKEVRPRIINEIADGLKAKQKIVVPARVRFISTDGDAARFCFVDILGLGINGILRRNEWSHEMVKGLRDVTKPGDVINVAIQGYSNRSTPVAPRFICSRKATIAAYSMEKSWENIEERYPRFTHVVVKCVERREKFFIGRLVGVDDAPSAYCLYPDYDKGIYVGTGRFYAGYVKTVDEEKKIFRIKITDALPESYNQQ